MLIKLDSGEYINTNFIEFLGKSDGAWFAGMNRGESQKLTDNDKDRIVEVMVKPSMTEDLVEAVKKLDADLGYFAG